jgi:ABC-2 type transport system ATP-binding protein
MGKTRLLIDSSGEEEEKIIGGHPEDLAAALRPYGLSPEVAAVSVEADSLENVVLWIIGEEVD